VLSAQSCHQSIYEIFLHGWCHDVSHLKSLEAVLLHILFFELIVSDGLFNLANLAAEVELFILRLV
jgi:hypothetical protein